MTNRQSRRGLLARIGLLPLAGCLLGVAPNGVAQTCNGAMTPSTPSGDFTDNGNGTVTHRKTGLMWKKCPEGQSGADCATGSTAGYTWSQALQLADTHSFAGYNDWRLPNKNELASIVEEACYGPSINVGVFPATPSSAFWSSSPYAYDSDDAWIVEFYFGYVNYYGRSNGLAVRLARGGQ